MKSIARMWLKCAALALIGLTAAGCRRPAPSAASDEKLLPAYTRNQITDPKLRQLAEAIEAWAAKQVGADGQRIYSRSEVLPPAQTVQPYGVGAYQQELRLPIILTTGPGWSALKSPEKESVAAQTFRAFAGTLQALKREPPLQPLLTIQTPQGIELAWINHLEPGGKNVHGDD